jgi:hypothetical protein
METSVETGILNQATFQMAMLLSAVLVLAAADDFEF